MKYILKNVKKSFFEIKNLIIKFEKIKNIYTINYIFNSNEDSIKK